MEVTDAEGQEDRSITLDLSASLVGADGSEVLEGTVAVRGLGGQPYRDGGYAYYTGEKVVPNDPKGIGAFLLAVRPCWLGPLSFQLVPQI